MGIEAALRAPATREFNMGGLADVGSGIPTRLLAIKDGHESLW